MRQKARRRRTAASELRGAGRGRAARQSGNAVHAHAVLCCEAARRQVPAYRRRGRQVVVGKAGRGVSRQALLRATKSARRCEGGEAGNEARY